MRMIQIRDGLCFPLKAFPQVRPQRQVRGKNLNRDSPIEPRVGGPIHLSHPARTDPSNNLVMPKLFPDERLSLCSQVLRTDLKCRPIDKPIRSGFISQQRLQLTTQFNVSLAGLFEEGRTLLFRHL